MIQRVSRSVPDAMHTDWEPWPDAVHLEGQKWACISFLFLILGDVPRIAFQVEGPHFGSFCASHRHVTPTLYCVTLTDEACGLQGDVLKNLMESKMLLSLQLFDEACGLQGGTSLPDLTYYKENTPEMQAHR